MTETVYVAGRPTGRYHTDRDCTGLNSANKIREREKNQLTTYEECRKCAGDLPEREELSAIEYRSVYADLLEQASPDEFP